MARIARSMPIGGTKSPNPTAFPADMAGLMAYAQSAESLSELTGVFSHMIASRGFSAHICIEIGMAGRLVPLFGDAAILPEIEGRGLADAPGDLLLEVQSWHGGDLFLCLTGHDGPTDHATVARLRGWAEVYATFGMALLERERDIPTSAGLGLAQRQCLAQLLIGRTDQEIASMLHLTPLAVRGHIENAQRRLHVDTRAEAISLAARRGWLAGIEQCDPAYLSFRTKFRG